MGESAPNLSYHYWFLGIIGKNLKEEADPLVLVRGSEFDPSKEITQEDDEGHTGTATTIMSSFRNSASSNPSFSDKCRYKEGWEDIWLLLLGSADVSSGAIRKRTVSDGVFEYTFAVNPANPADPFFCTLYNGFAKSEEGDTFKYENCLLNELEVSGSNEDAATYTASFASNFPKFRQPNIARTIPKKTIFPKSPDVNIYIAPEGDYTSLDDIKDYAYPCYIDWSFDVNNNVESQPCSSDEFGDSTKVLGNREATLSITLPWNDKTKKLEYKYMGGSESATNVSTENDVKTVWIVMKGGKINSTADYQTIIKIPSVVLTNADSPQSGSDAKQLSLEGKIEDNGMSSFIETVITTDLEDLHIDNTVGANTSP